MQVKFKPLEKGLRANQLLMLTYFPPLKEASALLTMSHLQFTEMYNAAEFNNRKKNGVEALYNRWDEKIC